MPVNGLRKFSLIDYPGRLACVVFGGHCNFRCPFCHNPALVFDPESQGVFPPEELAEFFRSRRGKLDGVVFSGGEPTLLPELERLAASAKAAGLAVKLDTNGSRPEVVESLFRKNLLDDLGIDFKAPFAKYASVCGNPDPLIPGNVAATIRFALEHGMVPDVRTTVHRALLSEEDLSVMNAERLALGVKHWVLQQFHHAELIDESLNDRETWSDSGLRAIAATLGPGVRTRGA